MDSSLKQVDRITVLDMHHPQQTLYTHACARVRRTCVSLDNEVIGCSKHLCILFPMLLNLHKPNNGRK
uniref:Uncharacterized protein n=1 Tax=Rhizophora mucronata TaxID=61149 RepID=A0A2P2Q7H2_RHIMU